MRTGPARRIRVRPGGPAGRGWAGAVSWLAALAWAFLLAACAGPDDPVSLVKAARIPPDTGKTVEAALSGYGYFTNPVWETYVDGERRTVVRFVAEYDVARGLADCPPVGPEVRPAARVFVTVLFVLQGDGAVFLADAFIDAYSAAGYAARYLAEPGIADRIFAGQACVGCMALYLPASL